MTIKKNNNNKYLDKKKSYTKLILEIREGFYEVHSKL